MDRFVEDSDGVAAANQRRMNADPFETLLINMGYDIQGRTAVFNKLPIVFAQDPLILLSKTHCSL